MSLWGPERIPRYHQTIIYHDGGGTSADKGTIKRTPVYSVSTSWMWLSWGSRAELHGLLLQSAFGNLLTTVAIPIAEADKIRLPGGQCTR